MSANTEAEKAQFNAMTQDEAQRLAGALEGSLPVLRSCWHCNSAHEHLRDTEHLLCFVCGIRYLHGLPGPIFGMRMRGETVTDDHMAEFQKALAEGAL